MLPRALLQLPDVPSSGVLPWEVLIPALVLLVIYMVARGRGDLPEAMGFTRGDVALLTLGVVAAQSVTLPLFPVGGALFGVNLGGVLVPLLLIWRLAARGTLPVGRALVGATAVAAATWMLVEVDPTRGVVVAFPEFLVPAAVALTAGLVLGGAKPVRAGPLAFGAGSLGTLVGADLVALPIFVAAAGEVPAGTGFVLGGGGAFDLVFLSGALGLALSMVLALSTPPTQAGSLGADGTPTRVADPDRLLQAAEQLPGWTARERCLVHLARADRALSSQQLGPGVAEARRAVDALLATGQPRLLDQVPRQGAPRLVAGLRELNRRAGEAPGEPASWHEAADTVELAKAIAGRLWPHVPGQVRLEGWRL